MNDFDPDDPEDVEIHLRNLLLRWSVLNNERLNSSDLAEDDRNDLSREWWRLTSQVLWMLAKPDVVARVEPHPTPFALFSELARMADDLGNGIPPQLLQGVLTPYGHSFSFDERKIISIALFYIAAAEEGRISDRTPKKSVRMAFGVNDQSVRDWRQREREICAGMPGADYSPEKLVAELRSAGQLYQRNSRSQIAIRSRNKKKTDT